MIKVVARGIRKSVGLFKLNFYRLFALFYLKTLPSGNFKLSMPHYFDQFAGAKKHKLNRVLINDKRAAVAFGASNLNEYTYWAWRSCALANLKMLLLSLKGKNVKLMSLVRYGLKLGGYDIENDLGWYHASLVSLAKKYGLKSLRKEDVPLDLIPFYIHNDYYVMASMYSDAGGHLLLLYGYKLDKNKKVKGFWLHDPGKIMQKDQYVHENEFIHNFKSRIILFK